jgi:hypothetical protein
MNPWALWSAVPALAAPLGAGRQAPAELRPVYQVEVRYQGAAPRHAAGAALEPFRLLAGDLVHLDVVGVESGRVTGRTAKFDITYHTERNAGRRNCRRRVERQRHDLRPELPTQAVLFEDFAPCVVVDTLGGVRRLGQRRTTFVAERACVLRVADLFRTPNLVLEPGATLTPAEQRELDSIRAQLQARAVGPVQCSARVEPGSVGGLRLRIVVLRRQIR